MPQFIVSPNPATGMVNVSSANASQLSQTDIASKSVLQNQTISQSKIYQVKVVDQLGNVKKVFNYSSGVNSVNIDLSSLINGTYILQVYDNVSWSSQQVVILK